MTNPDVRPRDLTLEPAGFGKVRLIPWVAVDGRDQIDVDAAWVQHEWAYRTRELMERRRASAKVVAKGAGISYDRLMKLLRGDAVATLRGMAAVDWFLRGGVPAYSQEAKQSEREQNGHGAAR